MTFVLGDVALPPDAAVVAESLCREYNLTRQKLYIKWEAWAVSQSNDATVPSASDLHKLSNHLRLQASKSTPKSNSGVQKMPEAAIRNKLLYTPLSNPRKFDVDEFFTYVDDPGSSILPDEHAPDPLPLKILPDPSALSTVEKDLEMATEAPAEEEDLQMAGADVVRPPPVHMDKDTKPDQTFFSREGSGRVEATLNGSPDLANHTPIPTRIAVKPFPSSFNTKSRFRYMNDGIPNRIETIREHMRSTSDHIFARLSALTAEGSEIQTPRPESFFVPSSEVVMAAGRVRVELDGSEGVAAGRINPSSVLLESEDGNVVKLDLSRMVDSKLPLFLHPGMIVLVEGVNTNGRILQVHAVHDNAMTVPCEVNRGSEVPAHDEDDALPGTNEPLDAPFAKGLFAAGPYTTSKNLNYEPLEDLLAVVARSRPDVVFMAGPFVDADHDEISPTTPVPFQQVFETSVLQRIRKVLDDMSPERSPHFFLIPGTRDMHHHFVCPQPPFELKQWERHQNMSMLSNPSVVELSARNGSYVATVGMSSLPALEDISADCLCWNRGDRFSAIASTMLRQCSFYPTFPATETVPLDTSLLDDILIPPMKLTPTLDILVTPSKLKTFVKCADGGAVAINPGLLCRGSSGGTFAEVKIPLHDSSVPRPLNMNADKVQASIIRL